MPAQEYEEPHLSPASSDETLKCMEYVDCLELISKVEALEKVR